MRKDEALKIAEDAMEAEIEKIRKLEPDLPEKIIGELIMEEHIRNKIEAKIKKGESGYHPNSVPYKVIVYPVTGKSLLKREFSTMEKAEKYAMALSLNNPRWRITIEYLKISTND